MAELTPRKTRAQEAFGRQYPDELRERESEFIATRRAPPRIEKNIRTSKYNPPAAKDRISPTKDEIRIAANEIRDSVGTPDD